MPIDQDYLQELQALGSAERVELRGRLVLWASTVSQVGELLEVAKRKRAYAEQSEKGAAFPTTHDAYTIADHLPVLGAVMFSALLKGGKAAHGSVAGNKASAVNRLRRSVEEVAFPTPAEFERLRSLQAKLERGRDTMIAHLAGPAFNVSQGATLTSLWPVSAAVQWEDIDPWLSCIGPLSESLSVHEWLLLGGEYAEAALQQTILTGDHT